MAADGLLRTVPVVVVSTEGSETRIQELRRQGIRGYVRKPFTPEEIKAVVENVLGGHDGT
jgi:two-component system chemotaxis response regulator CheY